jgi:hypothetical protein
MGEIEIVTWTRGSGEDVSSIAVSYSDGVVDTVAASNLK